MSVTKIKNKNDLKIQDLQLTPKNTRLLIAAGILLLAMQM